MVKGLPQAFLKQWPDDPYAIRRTAALSWLGDRYLLSAPINKTRRQVQAMPDSPSGLLLKHAR